MTNRTAANRYARSLLDVAVREKVDLAQLEAELTSFADLFKQNPALEKVMLNPAVPVPRKRAAMDELTKRARTSTILTKLLLLLAERDRLVLLPDMLDEFRDRLLDKQQVVRAEVTSAVPLAPEQTKTIERSLAALTGRTVKLGTRVDPSLIGGAVARVGDTLYDGSVTTQLERMKRRLTEAI